MNNKILSKVIDKIKIPKKQNLDIPRRNMPQIKTKHIDKFKDWIESEGIQSKETTISPKDLKPTQKDFNTEKVRNILNKELYKLDKLILVSKDGFILDGHHKWLAHFNLNDEKPVKVLQVDLNAEDFLEKAKEFPKVQYKDIKDNTYKNTDPKLKYASIIKKVRKKIKNSSAINLIETKDMELIKEMAKSKSYDAHIDLARNKNTPVEVLWTLVKSKEDEVRLKVISNPNITSQILQDLAKDKSMEVREAVALHPKTSTKTLEFLSMDLSFRVRSEADKRLSEAA